MAERSRVNPFKPPGCCPFKGGGFVVVDLLFNVIPIVCGGSVFVFVFYALLCVHSSFAIVLTRRRKMVDLLLLSYRCFVTVNGLWLLLTVPWVGLQYVIVVFTDHTNLISIIAIISLG